VFIFQLLLYAGDIKEHFFCFIIRMKKTMLVLKFVVSIRNNLVLCLINSFLTYVIVIEKDSVFLIFDCMIKELLCHLTLQGGAMFCTSLYFTH
jgi:hypothetical protein